MQTTGAGEASVAFRRYWAAFAVSSLGDAVTLVAMPLLAIRLLDADALAVGLITTAGYAAWLLVGLPAGLLVERLPMRATQVATDLIRAAAIASLVLAALVGRLTLAHVVAVAFVVGVASVLFGVGQMAYLPLIADAEDLDRRNGQLSGTLSTTGVAGPGIGGLLVNLIGPAATLLVDVVSYLFSAATWRRLPSVARARAADREQPLGAQLAAGWRFIRGHPVMRANLLAATVVNFVCAGMLAVVPSYLVRDLGASSLLVGLLMASEGVGAVIGALLAARVSRAVGAMGSAVTGALAAPVLAVLIPLGSGRTAMALFFLGYAGFAGAIALCSIAIITHRQRETPPELLPRVLATSRFVSWGVTPFGAMLAGLLAQATSPTNALWALAATSVLAPALLLGAGVHHSDPAPGQARP